MIGLSALFDFMPDPALLACVYVIRNTVNGKCYVGKTNDVEDRWQRHLWTARSESTTALSTRYAIHYAIRKYGEVSFVVEVVGAYVTDEEALQAEKEAIVRYDSRHNGYNEDDGGLGGIGRKHTVESREKMRMAMLGTSASEATRQKMSAVRMGHPVSVETRQKMRERMTGRVFSDETRQKMRAAKLRPEELARVSFESSHRGPISEETRAKMREAALNRSGGDDEE